MKTLQVGKSKFDLGKRTIIMGILNFTPDSFSDGNMFFDLEKAVQHGQEMVAAGADIIDIGGESTRPNFEPVSAEEELRRVLPVIKALREVTEVPISIDTYKAEVARQAIEAGANMLNDIWGCKADPEMAHVAACYHVPICLMHNKKEAVYNQLIPDILAELQECIDIAKAEGVEDQNIIIDPGIGFGKTLEHNLEVMHQLQKFKVLGYPLLLGTSRKSMIGKVLDLPVEERVEGTAASVAVGIAKGADIIRIHDVRAMSRVAKMTDAMIRR
ncbi:dihydropteroate synthase [Bacillota bacterium LX-D]|nr:dihydropteroate synthase [Bacillota bacterium LX-D]